MSNVGKPISSWRTEAKCAKLAPSESDAIFFPKPGGKSKTADIFCSDCPVRNKCLNEALLRGGSGFWAGTTEPERRRMTLFLKLLPNQLDDFMPVEPTARSRRLILVPVSVNVLNDPLYDVADPTEADLLAVVL